MIDDIIQLNQAREGFTNLINQVNSVLRFIVTGEMDAEEAEVDAAVPAPAAAADATFSTKTQGKGEPWERGAYLTEENPWP